VRERGTVLGSKTGTDTDSKMLESFGTRQLKLQGVPKKWKNKKTSSLLLHIIHFSIKKISAGLSDRSFYIIIF
jgi:hypothetical protein